MLLGYCCFWALSHIVTFTSIFPSIHPSGLSPVSLLVHRSSLYYVSLSLYHLSVYISIVYYHLSIYHNYLSIDLSSMYYLSIDLSSVYYLSTSSVGKEFACSAGDLGSIPGLGRFPGEGSGNPLQYPCLENLMDRGAWWAAVHGVTKSQARLSD